MTIPENTKLIPLTQGKFAIVDADDYPDLLYRKWQCHSSGYAVLGKYTGYKNNRSQYISVYMHREILQAPPHLEVDHINRNPLDNRKCNLRLVSRSQNSTNKSKRKNATSQYKGVYWNKQKKKWMVRILRTYLGYYHSEEEAALAYNKAAMDLYGEYACLNILIC